MNKKQKNLMVMNMYETVLDVKLKGDVANLMNRLIKKGYAESKEDLVRTSLTFYGMQLGMLSPQTLHRNILMKIRMSGRHYSDEEITEQIKKIR